MESIRIEKLRCLTDTGDIAIKPVTVLLGQNSSGKSTFLRVFPLLKQSIESRTTGPILWNGRLVDFGNYDDAHQSSSTNSILFHFKFQVKKNKDSWEYRRLLFAFDELSKQILHDLDINLILKITKDKNQEVTKISEITLCFSDSKIIIEFDKGDNISAFSVNSLNVLEHGGKYIFRQSDNNYLLPTIYESMVSKKETASEIDLSSKFLRMSRYRNFLTLAQILFDCIKKRVHHFTAKNTILTILFSFGIGDSESMLNDIQNNKYAGKRWKNHTKKWTTETKEFQEIRDLIIANAVPLILESCNQLIANLAERVKYMGPVRATAERYYRIQDLAIDEVDYQGQNLAMFFRNLTKSEKDDFDKWTHEYFGFKLSIESSLGHISLKIQSEDSNQPINVADTGFGFSQILPVITQLWLLSSALPKRGGALPKRERVGRGRDNISPVIFAIEQPEFHLHPRLQGVLTDAFVKSIKAAKANEIDLRLMIETHSEALVNRLGDLVADGTIAAEDINIVLFEPAGEPDKVNVRIAEFDSEGYLVNWALGFFNR